MRQNESTTVIGTNVILVPYKEKHVERYHEWMKSEELQRLTGSEPLTLEEEFQMQQRWHQDKDKCTFIVLDKETFSQTNNEIEAMIGDTNIFFTSLDDLSSAEIEIMIADAKFRSKKRGWEATVLMLLYGIETLLLKRYEAKIKLDNDKSINMFQKLGFEEISRSEVFQELTLEKIVDQNWRNWLKSQINYSSVKYEPYNI